VLATGSPTSAFARGDPVLCSFVACGRCGACGRGHPALCLAANELNAGSLPARYTLGAAAVRVGGSFFGQSSFARVAVVKEASVVPAASLLRDSRSDDELKLFAPLGCGLMTGAGSIVNVARLGEDDEVVILGVGGVGLGALMAAKASGVKTIIAVDRVEERLELAKSLGATAVIATGSFKDLGKEFPEAAKNFGREKDGVTCVIDTTGYVPLIHGAVPAVAIGGQLLIIAVPDGPAKLEEDLMTIMNRALIIKGVRLGDAVPSKLIPKMVEWYRQGLFPLEKFSKFYEPEQINAAVDDMLNGQTIKPILVWK